MQSTYKQRTIDSARAQLDGLYGKPLAWPEIDPQFDINIVPDKSDLILHVDNHNCERFGEVLKKVKRDRATEAMLAQVDADLEATLFPELRQITNMTDATTSDMHNVCNYIYWANLNSVELVFTLTQEQMNQCNVSY